MVTPKSPERRRRAPPGRPRLFVILPRRADEKADVWPGIDVWVTEERANMAEAVANDMGQDMTVIEYAPVMTPEIEVTIMSPRRRGPR
jgi:hypothetical protein